MANLLQEDGKKKRGGSSVRLLPSLIIGFKVVDGNR